MKDLVTPLSESELDRLDKVLFERRPGDDNEESDDCILNVSMLDGFFTVIVSAPVMVPPSQWLPLLWGKDEPEWQSEKEFEEVLMLLLRHMNDIASLLMDAPEEFEPIFYQREVDSEFYTLVDDWCYGYYHGMTACFEDWLADDELATLLEPILVFATPDGWET